MSSPTRRTVCHNVAELWAKPTRKSERVSQLLMGARVTVLESQDGFARVQGPDTYRGWIEERWLAADPAPFARRVTAPFAEVRTAPTADARLLVRLPGGAALRTVGRANGGWIRIALPGGQSGWAPAAAIGPAPALADDPATVAVRAAADCLGTPYLWGGSSPYGFDCSGLVQFCYARAGVTLRRDADIQRSDPRFAPVARPDLRPGDLVFFGAPERITHVGMHVGDGAFVHAAGGAGVIVTAWGDDRYSPGYVDARRLRPECRTLPVSRHRAEDR